MAARDPWEREAYDQERIVHEEHAETPDAVVQEEVARQRVVPLRRAGAEPVADPDAPTAAYDTVVRETPAAVRQERVVYEQGYAASDSREDVLIDRVVARRAALERVTSFVWFLTGLLEAALGLRIVFQLLHANRASGFVSFIYGFTEPFARPFQGIFNNPTSGNAVLDTAAVVGMVVYALVAWAIVRLIWLGFDRAETGRTRAVTRLHSDRY